MGIKWVLEILQALKAWLDFTAWGFGESMETLEVERRLQAAVAIFRDQDRHLLEVDASERSITHRLAVHLECLFPDWDVDCEYNRVGPARKTTSPKSINLQMAGLSETRRTGRIYPDIIVHRRGSDSLLAVEVKKHRGAGWEDDYRKAEAYVRQRGYEHACAVVISRKEDRYRWVHRNP